MKLIVELDVNCTLAEYEAQWDQWHADGDPNIVAIDRAYLDALPTDPDETSYVIRREPSRPSYVRLRLVGVRADLEPEIPVLDSFTEELTEISERLDWLTTREMPYNELVAAGVKLHVQVKDLLDSDLTDQQRTQVQLLGNAVLVKVFDISPTFVAAVETANNPDVAREQARHDHAFTVELDRLAREAEALPDYDALIVGRATNEEKDASSRHGQQLHTELRKLWQQTDTDDKKARVQAVSGVVLAKVFGFNPDPERDSGPQEDQP